MRKFIVGLVAGLVLATTGVAGAVTLGDWQKTENDGVICSIGRKGSNVDTGGVCVTYGGTYGGWTFSFDTELGVVVENNHRRIVSRGPLGRS